MKKQKLLTILFCVAILISVFAVTASAQIELVGTTYRLFMHSAEGGSMNADAIFQADNVFILTVGTGAGFFIESPPAFVAAYRALGASFANVTGDLTVFMAGAVYGTNSEQIAGAGLALVTVPGESQTNAFFYFTGVRIVTGQ